MASGRRGPGQGLTLTLTPATAEQAEAIAALRSEVAADLTRRFGEGHWSAPVSVKSVQFNLVTARVYVAHMGPRIAVTLALQTKKPWAIDATYFTACQQPLYLINMAVAPDLQRRGLGRRALSAALALARQWPADTIRLDAYDAPAGAGVFYARCGFREVGRMTYRETPLVYFERLL